MPTSSFARGAASTGAKKVASSFAKGVPAGDNPWKPVLSFGQTLIDIVSTPLYAVEGGIAAAQKGKNPIVGAAENAVAWTNGKRPATGSDILKNAGMSNDFWSSLAADIALDPLTYTPGVVISAPIKAVLAGARFGIKGGSAAVTKRAVSETAAKFTKSETGAAATTIVPAKIKVKTKNSPAQLEKIVASEQKMQKFVYTPVELTGQRSVSQAMAQMLASGVEAGYKGARMSIEKSLAKNTVDKIARKEGREILAGRIKTILPSAVKSADNIAENVNKVASDISPAQVAAETANTVRAQNIPVIDSAPIKVTPLELSAIQNPLGKANAKVYESRLAKLEKFIKTIKVQDTNKEDIIKNVGNALGNNTQRVYKFFADTVGKNADIVKNVEYSIKNPGTSNPVALLRQYAESADSVRSGIVKALGNTSVGRKDGAPLLIKDLIANPDYAASYANLDSGIGPRLLDILQTYLAIAKGGNEAIIRQNSNVIESGLGLGREMALKISKTGAFDPSVPTDAAALKRLLDEMPDLVSKSYESTKDFFDGLRVGHQISADAMSKVLRLIDPEGKQLDELDKAIASGRSTDVLKTALLTTGYSTVKSIQRNLKLLNAEKFLDQSNMSMVEVAFITDSGTLDALKELDTASNFSTRELAGERLVRAREQGVGDAIDLAANNIGRGMTSQYGSIFERTEQGISKLGQVFSRSYKKDGQTEAFLSNVASQYLETKVLASYLAVKTFRRDASAASKARKNIEYNAPDSKTTLEDFVNTGNIMKDIFLAQYGVRVTHVRSVKATKGLKENAYHHYVDVTDVGNVFLEAGQHDLFASLVMPLVRHPELDIVKTDSVSFQVIGDIVSDVLRGIEKKTEVDPAELLKRLKTPPNGKKWSNDFKAVVNENAQKFVDFMTDEKNANIFADIQKSRVKAELLDLSEPAQRFSSAMVETLLGAFGAARNKNIISQADRDKAVYDWMLKFAAVADIFAFSNGNVAREVFRSTANLFLQLGDPQVKGLVVSEYRQKLQQLASSSPDNADIYKDIMDAFESYPKWDSTVSSQIKDANKDLIDEAQKLWATSKDTYNKSLEGLTTDMDVAQITAWYKNHKVAQASLKAAREKMGKAGIETDYWNGEAWVSAERFNRKAALKNLEKMPNRLIYTKSGTIDIAKFLVDGEVDIPTFKQYGVRHTAASRKVFDDMAAARRSLITKNEKANAQETVVGNVATYEAMLPDEPLAQVGMMNEQVSYLRHDEAIIKVDINTGVDKKIIDQAPVHFLATTYKAAKSEEGTTIGGRLAEKLQGGSMFRDLAPIMAGAESTAHSASAAVSEVLNHVFRFFRQNNMQVVDMDEALDAAVNKISISAIEKPNVSQLAEALAGVYESTTTHAISRGLTPAILRESFKLLKIDKYVPWDSMRSPDDIHKIMGWLPIGGRPAYLEQSLESLDLSIKASARVAANNYDEAKAIWASENAARGDTTGSITLFQRAIAAVQRASVELNTSAQLVEDFNYMNYFPGMSKQAAYEAALKSPNEFVRIKTKTSGPSFTRWFAEEDNLFQKDIAKQIGAFDRHYNYMSENNMSKFVQHSMTILGIFKTTQTTLRPGHLINTGVGDSIMSLMRGTNPLMFKMAADVSMTFAGQKAVADWSKSAGAKRLQNVETSLSNLTPKDYAEAASGFTFPIGGKAVTWDKETLIDFLFGAGGLRTNVGANDEFVQQAELQSFRTGTDQATTYNKMILEKMTAGKMTADAKRIWLTATKPAGDIVAAVGNIPRVATALDVMKKGNFKTVEDMRLAVIEELGVYHPMIEQLSAFERQKIRPLFSYYTWLKGAHYAILKMSMEHTKVLLLPSKIFYNQALANEMGPASIGNLWGNKEDTPSYLNYSTYGPTMKGPRGGIVYRPSVPFLDVVDTWNIQFDSTKSIDKQTFDNLKSVGQGVFGKNINMVFQPGLEFLTGTDPSTGSPSTVKDLQTAGDSLLSNIGTFQLLQGLGLYTPSNKGPDSPNPTTQRDKDIKLFNFGVGARLMDTGAPSSVKNAKSDYNARMKRIQEILLAEQDK